MTAHSKELELSMAQLSEDLLTLKAHNDQLQRENVTLKEDLDVAVSALKKIGGKEDLKAIVEENK